MSAVNVKLLAFVAKCRAVTSAAVPLVVYTQCSVANTPHVGAAVAWRHRQTDRLKIMS